MRAVTVLGATGSIGLNTLDVIGRHPERFRAWALAARRDDTGLFELCRRHRPARAVLLEEAAAERLRRRLREAGLDDIEVAAGEAALVEAAAAPEADTVVAGIVGAAGLLPTLAAARAGKRILLANKEVLVMAGALFMRVAAEAGARVLPLDSEHNAIWQCLPAATDGVDTRGVRRILLTASGGPLRDWPLARLADVTPKQACAHPNWRMGRKISVDSATMMNKGLELIEACWLFGLPPERIDVLLHPQSIVHSLVEYRDGSMLAQLAQPDMRVPIAHALGHPERIESGAEPLDLCAVASLDFAAPDPRRFPCLGLAVAAARAGGSAPVVLNAANEVAVAAFLESRLRFDRIAAVVEATLERAPGGAVEALAAVLECDRAARVVAEEQLRRHGRV